MSKKARGKDEKGEDPYATHGRNEMSPTEPPKAPAPVARMGRSRRFRDELPRMFGKYRLTRLLGEGGMGAVYLAEDTKLGDRPVAIKLPKLSSEHRDAEIERFLREARLPARLRHPNICTVFEADEIDGEPYLAVEYIAGQTLGKVIEQEGPFSEGRAVELAIKIARALEVAHKAKIIHRDLKPANIQIDETGEPTIMDFGLAVAIDETRVTKSGVMMGTPAYMPPEQANGDKTKIGACSDLYCLGVIFFEMLTKQVPYDGENAYVIIAKLIAQPTPAPSMLRPNLGKKLDEICLRAMAKNPDERFPTVAAFADALEDWKRDQRALNFPTAEMELPKAGKATMAAEAAAREFVTLKATQAPIEPAPAPKLVRPAPPPAPQRPLEPGAFATLATQKAGAISNPVDMKLSLIPAGEFLMGTVETDADMVKVFPGTNPATFADERPAHTVRLKKPFYMGIHAVTQGEFENVMGRNPSYFNSGRVGADTRDHPVENVTWYDAVEFCNRLSEREGKRPIYEITDITRGADQEIVKASVKIIAGAGYRLPTEAEWEYACRANSNTHYNVGDTLNGRQANIDDSKAKGPYLRRTTPVGLYEANAFGLFDMHGNVLEWCWDWYDKDFYQNPASHRDPTGPATGEDRVARGGSWGCRPRSARSSIRYRHAPDLRINFMGFRVVKPPLWL